MANQNQQTDVYMVTGFLEAGKTTFMQKFVLPDKPTKNIKFAVISFEEGEEEYDEEEVGKNNIDVYYFDRDNLNEEFLNDFESKHDYRAVFVEYNGMWQFQDFIDAMPENWAVVQVFNVMNSDTIMTENANMRQLVYDKLQVTDIAFFNRVGKDTDKNVLHKLVRAVSLQTNILFQDAVTMRVDRDEIEDELPFDMNANPIVIQDRDYAYFYRELCENTNSFEGKTVSFKGIAGQDVKHDKDTYVFGRHIMQCCAADIQFYGMVCFARNGIKMQSGAWYTITGKISIKRHPMYKNKGPVIDLISCEKAEALSEDERVATFY